MDTDDVRNRIHGWLLETGLQVQEAPLAEDSFRFAVRDPKLGTEVYQSFHSSPSFAASTSASRCSCDSGSSRA